MPNEVHVLSHPTTSSACDFWDSGVAVSRDYLALTKPEVNVLILITTLAGFYLAAMADAGPFPLTKLISTVAGTLLVASAAGALNQVAEKNFDARMRRTMRRPVAAGRLEPGWAFSFGTILAVSGTALLWTHVNRPAACLAVAALVLYLLVYTPLKRKSPLCTLAGAIPGAIPPLIGWVAVDGRLNVEAGALFALLFLWQFPHFMAIAWMYREDYSRAGYLVLPAAPKQGKFVAWWTVAPGVVLFALVTMMILIRGGLICLPLASILGCGLLYYSVRLATSRTNAAARQLLMASIVYLPAALSLLIFVEKYRRLTP